VPRQADEALTIAAERLKAIEGLSWQELDVYDSRDDDAVGPTGRRYRVSSAAYWEYGGRGHLVSRSRSRCSRLEAYADTGRTECMECAAARTIPHQSALGRDPTRATATWFAQYPVPPIYRSVPPLGSSS
jgi:hypothetical protein